jgi:hypothetical protein
LRENNILKICRAENPEPALDTYIHNILYLYGDDETVNNI